MGDKNLESSQLEGTEGAPSSEGSQKPGGQQTSSLNPEDLLKQVESLIDRKLQSTKDKRFAQLERTVNEFAPVLERFKGLVSDDKLAEIRKDLEFEDLKRRVYGDGQSSDRQEGNQPDNAASQLTAIIDEMLELPTNDSRVTDLKLKHGNDPKAYLSEGLKLFAKLGEQRESTPAEQPMSPGGGTHRQEENPIADIDDPKTLYRLAAQQMAKNATGRKRRVAS
jgi:hypothetical protein